MKKLFTLLLIFVVGYATAQINYTAQDQVTPYTGPFRLGNNSGYYPAWTNKQLADIAAGNAAVGQKGVGAKSNRVALPENILDAFGYEVSLNDFAHYSALGMNENVALIGGPTGAHRDYTQYCSGVPSELFANLYLPIWDGGANGTPYNDDNYFAAYMYKTVTIYKDHVRFWEIWNEPGLDITFNIGWRDENYPGNWFAEGPDPCDNIMHAPIYNYIRTLRIAWEIIKTIAPDDYVCVGSVGYQSFMNALLTNTDNPNNGDVTPEYPLTAGAYFDVVSYHSYPHIDGSTAFYDSGFFDRNSDRAADGLINYQNYYKVILDKYGYDGSSYPAKEWIVTEVNSPRQTFGLAFPDKPIDVGSFFGGNDAQVNHMMKVFMTAKVNKIHQLHPYELIDGRTEGAANYEFHLMGMYKNLQGAGPYNVQINDEGKAMKTMSDLIYETEFDQARTNAMNLPNLANGQAGVRGYAWRKTDGTYIYALWARTVIDLSEQASAAYSFPSNFNFSNVVKYEWDYGYSNNTQSISSQNITLGPRPIFFTAGEVNTTHPTVMLTTDNNTVTESFTVHATFSEDVTDFTLAEIQVTNGTKSNAAQQSASSYSFTITPVSAGNVTIIVPASVAFNNNGDGNLISNTLVVNYITDPPSGGVDLELTGVASNNNPAVYDNFSITYTLTNKGDATASSASVNIPTNSTGFVLVGGNEYELSAGAIVGANWVVNNLSAGTSETLKINYFNLDDNEKVFNVEVKSQSPNDIDSTPGNGIEGQENEDDESVVIVNGSGGGCNIQASISNIVCNDNGTANDPDDDTYTYQVLVTNAGVTGTWNRFNSNSQISSGTYGVPVTIDGGLITAAPLNPNTYLIKDAADATCSTTYGIAAPNSCSSGGGTELADLEMANITALPATTKQGDLVNFNFDLINSGTALASGDYTISIILSTDANVGNSDDVEVGVINTGNTAIGTISGVEAAISIPNDQTIGGYFLILIADSNNDITESDETNNFLSGSIQILESDGGGDDVDLELTASLSNNTPAQWSFFSTSFVVTNTGTENATGIKLSIPTPDGIVLKGGDEYNASQGSFQTFGANEWNVGTINAGTSATLTLNYFNRTNSLVSIFGQVTAQAEIDTDSSPNNNNSSTPSEDDEAVVIINVSSAASRQGAYEASNLSQNVDFQILNTYPTISNNKITIAIDSKKDTQLLMKIYNMKGQEVSQQQVNITTGANEIKLNISQLTSGMHHVMLLLEKGRPLTTRFIKQRL